MSSGADWGSSAEQQEKASVAALGIKNLSLNNDVALPTIPPPVPNKSPNRQTASTTEQPIQNDQATANGQQEPDLSAAEASLMRKILRSQLIKSTHDVEVQQKNPDSPLYSVKSFSELKLQPELLNGVYAMGFNSPSKIQETALPTLLVDPPQNMIAQSQSGTGKTAAFVLASLSRIDSKLKYPQVLILSPTYELAEQTGHVAMSMAQYCPEIKFCFALRGNEMNRGHKITEQFLIGTPGKVLDWALRFKFFDIKKIKVFVLDEADVMISTQGHQDQSIRIHKNLDKNCQMMMFSATYTQEVIEFAELIVSDPVIIRLKREEESLENIKQYFISCNNIDDKYNALSNIYGVISIGQAIIFCHTRKTAVWLSEKMTIEGHAVALLSGELSVEQRVAVLNRFREGKEKVLITTNVCARGIDVEQVTVVVNFDLPIDNKGNADCETYLHRIGRTGRFGKSGIAINMVDGRKSMLVLHEIEQHFGKKIQQIDADDVDDIEKMGR